MGKVRGLYLMLRHSKRHSLYVNMVKLVVLKGKLLSQSVEGVMINRAKQVRKQKPHIFPCVHCILFAICDSRKYNGICAFTRS